MSGAKADRESSHIFRELSVIEPLESRLLLSVVPAGYNEVQVASGLTSPISMVFAPDGRLFVTEQAGDIRVVKNGSLLATHVLDLTVDSQGERGMLSMAFDPNFATNKFVYVYYTATTPTIHNRVSRFTMNGDTIDPASETVLFDLDPLVAIFHMGGDIHFGGDGKLYFTAGDNLDSTNSQSLATTKGKVLRINPDGSIPTDNPFYNTLSGNYRAIWAYGLRNPYTFDVQPGTGTIFIDDVGQVSWEEIDPGIAGANYGWPNAEGTANNPAYTDPIYTYAHPVGGNGAAITGGAFYNPVTAEFPTSMVGKYFFADYVNGFINVLDPATKTATPFATSVPSSVNLKVSPDGELYYLSRDTGAGVGAIFRIRYIDAPTITTQPQSQSVSPGSAVSFSVQATGAGPLSYQWQRDGVNIAGATGSSYTLATTTGADNGAKFRVIITDSLGNASLSNGATWTPGQSGSAVNFDGIDDVVTSGLDLNQWLGGTATLTAWIKTTQVGSSVFWQAPGITGTEQYGGSNDIFWGWIDDTGRIGLQAGNTVGARSANPINDGAWHFLALTRDSASGAVKVYVDGALSGSATSDAGFKSSSFYNIGSIGDSGGTPGYLKGALDDVRIYNRVLTAGEVSSGNSLPASGLVTRYAFDENAGTTAYNAVAAGGSTTSDEATLTVAAGSAPTAQILTPTVGTTYTAGDTISFSGSATDQEDGTLPASAYTWDIQLHHDTHFHPAMLPTSGITSGTFVIPTLGETSDSVSYRITLKVTDSSGLTTTVIRDVFPIKATITVNSNVPGAALTLDGKPITSPTTFIGVAGIQRTFSAPETQIIGGITYTFDSWSDGGAATHTIFTPAVDSTYTATYKASPIQTTYVSDLTPTSAVNGWGPYEKDTSNGEDAAGDGHTITLNGVTYAKGLGVHANSDISYNIAGKGFKTFASDIGLDDETAFYGNVIFRIYLDGAATPVYDSGLMNNNSATKSITIDVTGKSTLRLVVNDGGDQIYHDHADWANARLTSTGSTNTSPVATILTPAVGAKYSAGTTLSFSGTGTDPEDGTLAAGKFAWKVDRVKAGVATNVLTTAGATSGSYAIPATGDTDPTIFYRVTLTVTDSAGATNTAARDVLPNTVTLTLASSPAGVPITIDGTAATTVTSVVGTQRVIAAPATATVSGTSYAFASWSDGGAATHTITTPGANAGYTASYTATVTPAGPVYLSDLTPTAISNGYGPYEKDKSNGEDLAGDGKTLTLNGVTYEGGLGVHAPSDLTFALGGKYATFISDIGLDDEVGSNGSVVFQVFLDGAKAYDSGKMTGATATKSLAINVAGKSTLRLVVTTGGDNFNFDHSDWAGARLLPANSALPSGWTSANVGSVGQTGSAGYVGGSFVVGVSGTDIAGTSDSFRYVYQQIIGNVQLTARVVSLGNSNAGAKAGVMLRSSLNANSIEAGMFLTAGSGFSATQRTTAGGSTTATSGGASAFPYWVRIVRSGNTVTTFRSTDGMAWTQVSSSTVTLGTTIYVGLAVTSKSNSVLTTAVLDNVSLVALP